ncbi:hypothetical protein JCM8097_001701 [Rhodosporidiobolus ruineniae]
MRSTLLALASFAVGAFAAPALPLEDRALACNRRSTSDAGSYSLPCTTYSSSLVCPNGLQGKSNGVVLLVHGTGSTGVETWGNGPYLKLLPDEGFDVCYINLPSRALSDIQTSAEYFAYNLAYLASKSATGKVGVVTHSQGALVAQWGFLYWPSIRSKTSTFVPVAGDFHGTIEAIPVCAVLGLLGGCNPSVFQQTVASNFLDALNVRGDSALVPTTSIYTAYDDVIQPELIAPTSRLNGAEVVRLQDKCGDAYIIEHFGIPFSSYAYYLALDALQHQSTADVQRVPKTACAWLLDDYLLDNFNRGPAVLGQFVADAAAVVLGVKSQSEPSLRSYVCKSGDATKCSSS